MRTDYIGWLSSHFESLQKMESVALSTRDPANPSFGLWQINRYNITAFTDQFPEFEELNPDAPKFVTLWKKNAKDKLFEKMYIEHCHKTFFEPVLKLAAKCGLPDATTINEAVISCGIQHSPKGQKIIFTKAANKKMGSYLVALYDARRMYVCELKLPGIIKNSILNRYEEELKLLEQWSQKYE